MLLFFCPIGVSLLLCFCVCAYWCFRGIENRENRDTFRKKNHKEHHSCLGRCCCCCLLLCRKIRASFATCDQLLFTSCTIDNQCSWFSHFALDIYGFSLCAMCRVSTHLLVKANMQTTENRKWSCFREMRIRQLTRGERGTGIWFFIRIQTNFFTKHTPIIFF